MNARLTVVIIRQFVGKWKGRITVAQFFKVKKKPSGSDAKTNAKAQAKEIASLMVEQFNHDGQGIGYVDNKICFVQGALPGEQVRAQIFADKAKMAKAKTIEVLQANPKRVVPPCEHFGQCGGCQLQFAAHDYQLELKQQAVSGLFKRFAKQQDLPWQPALQATPWSYRRAARIGVWFERKTAEFTVGFRRLNDKRLTQINHCAVLVKPFAALFSEFKLLLPQLQGGRSVTHLQVVSADNVNLVVVRHTQALSEQDKQLLVEVGKTNDWFMVSEYDKGCFEPLCADQLPVLNYLLAANGGDNIQLNFEVGDFIQVNQSINQQMINQAIDWLALDASDVVLDLFCGVGNFSLPLASVCDKVVGVEGVDAMVERATNNANINGLANVDFYQANLAADFDNKKVDKPLWLKQKYSKVLLDPARAGAQEIMASVARLKPQKVLYVSCEPLTLARDSAILIAKGYRLKKIALMDMFAHTRHVEVMVLFEKKG
jgi:23S rRNA (uracil1939-C5)-methyltransferase